MNSKNNLTAQNSSLGEVCDTTAQNSSPEDVFDLTDLEEALNRAIGSCDPADWESFFADFPEVDYDDDEERDRRGREAYEKRMAQQKAGREALITYSHAPFAVLVSDEPDPKAICNRYFNFIPSVDPSSPWVREELWTIGAATAQASGLSSSLPPLKEEFDAWEEAHAAELAESAAETSAPSQATSADAAASNDADPSDLEVTLCGVWDTFDSEFSEEDYKRDGREPVEPIEDWLNWTVQAIGRPLMIAARLLGEYEDESEAPRDAEGPGDGLEDTSRYGVSEHFTASNCTLGTELPLPSVVEDRARAAYMQMGMTEKQANAAIQLFLEIPYSTLNDVVLDVQEGERIYGFGNVGVIYAADGSTRPSTSSFEDDYRAFDEVCWALDYPLEETLEEMGVSFDLSMANILRAMVYQGRQEGDVELRVSQAVIFMLAVLFDKWWRHRTPYDERVIA